MKILRNTFFALASLFSSYVSAEPVPVEGQPLAANVKRLITALQFLGAPFEDEFTKKLTTAIEQQDPVALQELLDPEVLVKVSLNPEVRVKAERGPRQARLLQHGYTPVLIKVVNQSTSTAALRIKSPQGGPVYSGEADLSMRRQAQTELKSDLPGDKPIPPDRFLDLSIYRNPPMTKNLSGLEVEYVIALLYSTEAGKREATLAFDVGEKTQDLGFRGEVPILFDCAPAIPVALRIRDSDGTPTTARLTFLDRAGHVYPPQAKRVTPDLFFQKHIYRKDGETVLLPSGKITMLASRGPEYKTGKRELHISRETSSIEIDLERWINPALRGYYSGDHHIHASGCAHFTSPTVGVPPETIFRQVKGEGLNVGCILTWGPGFDHQQQFFHSSPSKISEPLTLLKYDIEVSGFGSAALGHVCLLNLKEQIYPGAEGSKNWPTWTTPVLRWAKQQGAVTGYAHSGSGLQIDPEAAAARLLKRLDQNKNQLLEPEESTRGLLPESFPNSDTNRNGVLSIEELEASHNRAADLLPNYAIPELNSVGAQEIFVTAAHGLCDFISAMDTARLREWNCWYHLMNCGLSMKVSGETDFPCMSGTRVGQGRVYVKLEPDRQKIGFTEWCESLRAGKSYVTDGYAHCLQFSVNQTEPGDTLALTAPGEIEVEAEVAFSSETPIDVKYGGILPVGGRRLIGDTVILHQRKGPGLFGHQNRERDVEIVMNGIVVASQKVPADDRIHHLKFKIPVKQSSWIALRHFPQLHTNPVNVTIAGKPIHPNPRSAQWCIDCIEQLWSVRGKKIAKTDQAEARRVFDEAIAYYREVMAAP